ncbi:MAG: aliphatic sulfonate ABC transporter substrate-binding protein [Carboxydocellales bacterium]
MVNKRELKWLVVLGLILGTLALSGCGIGKQAENSGSGGNAGQEQAQVTIRVGHFPNITHAQALIGLADGSFQKALGDKVIIDRKPFNAGPAEIEALLAGEIDLGYIGPVPAVNGFVKSRGGLQIIAGATNAGAVLVVRDGAGISSIQDLAGKKVAAPQFGNTQDISLRKVLSDAGLKSINKGGTVNVLQVENPDILTGFVNKELDAALVPEPWGSRLVKQAGGKILLNWKQVWREGNYTTAVLIVHKQFLQEHPDLVEKWIQAHVEITNRIAKDPEQNKALLNEQLKVLTKKNLTKDILDSSFARLTTTYDPAVDSIKEFVTLQVDNGYLKETPNLDGLVNLEILNKILKEKSLPEIK